MNEDQLRAIFTLAGIEILRLTEAPNPYSPLSGPQWAVLTSHGVVTLHWRKRVIDINWTGTKVRYPLNDQYDRPMISDLHVTRDEVTKSPTNVHADTYGAAANYLRALGQHFGRVDYLEDFKKRAALNQLTKEEIGHRDFYKTYNAKRAAEQLAVFPGD